MIKLKQLLVLGLLTASFSSAQLNRATMTGLVADPSNAVVPNVKIVATHIDTGTSATTTTNETGNYTMPGLQIGLYRVEFEANGFKKSVRDKVELTAGSTVRLNVALDIGAVGESVEVSAGATPIETETARVATNINTRLVQDLPIQVSGAVRSVFNLAIIAPETKTANGFRIGGGQGSGWEMTMDGMPTTSGTVFYQEQRAPVSTVPIDAIAEFTVETNGMKAEFGRANGAITFETKSGTNKIHGNLFELMRNNAFDARNFFDRTGKSPVLKQHDFGGTVGAPVYIPKIYDGHNKTFFFVSYQGFRNRAGTTNSTPVTIPTLANYQGDFSGYTRNRVMAQIYDPATTLAGAGGTTRVPFAGNLIPISRFSGVASRYLTLRPAEMVPNVVNPNGDPTQNYLRTQGSAISPWNKGSLRLDHSTDKDRFSVLIFKGKWEDLFGADGPPGLPVPFNGGSIWARKNTSGRFSWNRNITSRVINTFRISYQRERGDLATINSADPDKKWNELLKIPNVPGPDRALPAMSFTGYAGWSGSSWGLDAGGNLNIANDINIIQGKHSFKAGFFYAHDRWDGGGQHRPNGSFNFSNLATAIPGDTSQNTGNGFAAFLLGYASGGGVETPRIVRQYYRYKGGFFQDDWKVTSNLTLNLGIRYEYTSPVQGGAFTGLTTWEDTSTGKQDGFSNFDPTVPNPGAGGRLGALIFSGEGAGRTPGSMFDGYKKAISPRIGFAYKAMPTLVIRSSIGRQLGAVKATGASTHFDGFIVNSNITSNDNSVFDFPAMLDTGPPAWTRPPFIDSTVLNNQTAHFWQRGDSGRPSEYYAWNLDIQKEITSSTVASIAYSGTKGTYLASGLTRYNQIDPKYLALYGTTLLNSGINSTAARAANIPIPYAGFGSLAAHTVRRALQPFPQYDQILTNGGQPESVGERAGNSTYHAMVMKLDKRYSNGMTLLASYVLSKLISDSDSALISGGGSLDHFNRGLEKSLSNNDQTHVARFAFSYELPVGKGKALGLNGIANHVLGGWTMAGLLTYESGTPTTVTTTVNPIGTGNRVFITSYENWRIPLDHKFDPNSADRWLDRNAFNQNITAAQLNTMFGNAARNNPKLRTPWNLNENISIGKNFHFNENVKFHITMEAFNAFNRVRWGNPNSSINAPANAFGQITGQGNSPRSMQLTARFNF